MFHTVANLGVEETKMSRDHQKFHALSELQGTIRQPVSSSNMQKSGTGISTYT